MKITPKHSHPNLLSCGAVNCSFSLGCHDIHVYAIYVYIYTNIYIYIYIHILIYIYYIHVLHVRRGK